MSLYFVFLRRPRDLDDRRSDPFWEFGSFGRTGCHSANLLNPRTPLADGDRLAFLQGGLGEIRIVGVTPPIVVIRATGQSELKWDANYRPLPYVSAPLLIDNAGDTAFCEILSLLGVTKRSTWCGAAGSRLRSKTTPVDKSLADQILRWFSAQHLPDINKYPEAIQCQTGRWYQKAMKQGWATPQERREIYDRLALAAEPVGNVNIVPRQNLRKCTRPRR